MAISVLLIDDDPEVAVIMRTLLRGEDYQVRAVTNGEEGICACRDRSPDVIILDLMLPEMDGWQVCQRIREFSDIPILILSALGMPRNVASALQAGADDYMVKPVHARLLASRLRSLVQQHALSGKRQIA
ncbi:MAG: response regulator [Anaerolineales bacterium]|jgi:two-component system KDP operon response regulator KdpE